MFAGELLVEFAGQARHVRMDVAPRYDRLNEAFSSAGQGRLRPEVLDKVGQHESIVFLEFDGLMQEQIEWIATATRLIKDLGGYAVRVESCGAAHDWERWESALHGDLNDLYCLGVVAVVDADAYTSCGMRHFGLADCKVSSGIPMAAATEVMHHFNLYRLAQAPTLLDGHTFSVGDEGQVFRLAQEADPREADDPLFNAEGFWNLVAV